MLPGIAYYMSRWYRRSELAFRLSLYIVMAPLAGAFGGLLASGILKLHNFGSLKSWRMIFAIEGIITVGLSLVAFVTLTDRPETARWLSQEERDLAIARVKSERVGTTEVLDKIDRTKTLKGIFSPVTLVTSFIFLLGMSSAYILPLQKLNVVFRQHHCPGTGLLRAYYRADHLSQRHCHLTTTTHRTTLHRGCLLHRTLPFS